MVAAPGDGNTAMIPIQDLLHRIRWDADFGRGEFILAYHERIERKLFFVPLHVIEFPPDRPPFLS